MPPITSARRLLARWVAGVRTSGATSPPDAGIHIDPRHQVTVPIMVRAHSADDADLRLLIDVRLAVVDAPVEKLERYGTATVVPAVERWVRRRRLADLMTLGDPADLRTCLGGLVGAVAAEVEPELALLGAELVTLDLVAVEHLILSPSGRDGSG